MKMTLFSIFDRKMNIYLTPFPSRNQVDAVRQISASMGDASMKQTPVGMHPQDFDLVEIGSFDDETGDISRCHPITISSIADIVRTSTVPS